MSTSLAKFLMVTAALGLPFADLLPAPRVQKEEEEATEKDKEAIDKAKAKRERKLKKRIK